MSLNIVNRRWFSRPFFERKYFVCFSASKTNVQCVCALRGSYVDDRIILRSSASAGPLSSAPVAPCRAPAAANTKSSGSLPTFAFLICSSLINQYQVARPPASPEPEAIAVSCQCSCPAGKSTPCPAVWCETSHELPIEPTCPPSWQLAHGLAVVIAFIICAGAGCCGAVVVWVFKPNRQRVPGLAPQRPLVRIDQW